MSCLTMHLMMMHGHKEPHLHVCSTREAEKTGNTERHDYNELLESVIDEDVLTTLTGGTRTHWTSRYTYLYLLFWITNNSDVFARCSATDDEIRLAQPGSSRSWEEVCSTMKCRDNWFVLRDLYTFVVIGVSIEKKRCLITTVLDNLDLVSIQYSVS